jgi:hypothetical protein
LRFAEGQPDCHRLLAVAGQNVLLGDSVLLGHKVGYHRRAKEEGVPVVTRARLRLFLGGFLVFVSARTGIRVDIVGLLRFACLKFGSTFEYHYTMYINYKSFVTDVKEYDQQGINILNFDYLRLEISELSI